MWNIQFHVQNFYVNSPITSLHLVKVMVDFQKDFNKAQIIWYIFQHISSDFLHDLRSLNSTEIQKYRCLTTSLFCKCQGYHQCQFSTLHFTKNVLFLILKRVRFIMEREKNNGQVYTLVQTQVGRKHCLISARFKSLSIATISFFLCSKYSCVIGVKFSSSLYQKTKLHS